MRSCLSILGILILFTACSPSGGEPTHVRSIPIGKPTFTVERAQFKSRLERRTQTTVTVMTNAEVNLDNGLVSFFGKHIIHTANSGSMQECTFSRSLTASDLQLLKSRIQALEICRNIIPDEYPSVASATPYGSRINYLEGQGTRIDLLDFARATRPEYFSACYETEIGAISSLIDSVVLSSDPMICN